MHVYSWCKIRLSLILLHLPTAQRLHIWYSMASLC